MAAVYRVANAISVLKVLHPSRLDCKEALGRRPSKLGECQEIRPRLWDGINNLILILNRHSERKPAVNWLLNSFYTLLRIGQVVFRLNYSVFWVIKRREVVCNRRFGTTCRSHRKGSRFLDILTLENGTEW